MTTGPRAPSCMITLFFRGGGRSQLMDGNVWRINEKWGIFRALKSNERQVNIKMNVKRLDIKNFMTLANMQIIALNIVLEDSRGVKVYFHSVISTS